MRGWRLVPAVVMVAVVVVALAGSGDSARAQIAGGAVVTGGVAIDAQGVIRNRAEDSELAVMRRRLKESADSGTEKDLKCVSLPGVFAEAKTLLAAGRELPEELRYLGGLTQIRYVFVYPEQKDLVIAGPAEEWTGGNTLEPIGKKTGRPILQFYDLVEAMRTLRQGGDFFGCSIDPPADAQKISDRVAKEYGNKPRTELIAAMAKALGSQKITIIGTQGNTRLALAMVAADYKLKRFTMGLEKTPVEGIGNAVDDGRANGSRFWFTPCYDPLRVSPAGDAYAISGPRLQVKAGPQSFQTTGVTAKAKGFAALFSKKIPELARVEPALADLQNIADLAPVAALIRDDGLDQKVGWDDEWCLENALCPLPRVPVARTCQSVVAIQGNAVGSGGVAFSMRSYLKVLGREREKAGVIPASPALPGGGAWQTTLSLPGKLAPKSVSAVAP